MTIHQRVGRLAAIPVLLAGALAVSWGGGVRAFNPQPDPPGFGMIGITYGQTLRLNVVNTSGFGSRQYPPDPCKVDLAFLDAAGKLIRKAGVDGRTDDQPVRKAGRLMAGQSMFLDLDADGLRLEDGRAQVRPLFMLPSGLPPGPCRATIEVIDTYTGKTSFSLAGSPSTAGDSH